MDVIAALPTDDAIWDKTNPCEVSLDNIEGTETTANIDVIKESTVTTTTSMSTKGDELWFNAHEDSDSWYDAPETTDNYQEWDDPPNIIGDTTIINKSLDEHIEPDFYIGERQTSIQDV